MKPKLIVKPVKAKKPAAKVKPALAHPASRLRERRSNRVETFKAEYEARELDREAQRAAARALYEKQERDANEAIVDAMTDLTAVDAAIVKVAVTLRCYKAGTDAYGEAEALLTALSMRRHGLEALQLVRRKDAARRERY